MACGRIAEVVLLIYDFSTFSNCGHCRVHARQEGGRGWEVKEGCDGALKWRGGHALLIYDWGD